MRSIDNVGRIAPLSLGRAVAQYCEQAPEDSDAIDRLLDYLDTTRPTTNEILDAVGDLYGIGLNELIGENRKFEVALARQIFCYLAYHYTNLSMIQIGHRVGLIHHTTVHHAVRKIEKWAITKPLMADDLDLLRLKICEKILRRPSTKGRVAS